MPKPKSDESRKKPDASYEAFRAQWERAKPRRLQRETGRGKPGDMDYRPPLIGSPRPHKTKAADFLDELLWLGAYVGDDRFNQAYVAVQESGAIKDGKWAKAFRVSSPPGHTADPFQSCVSLVARMTWLLAPSGWRWLGRSQHSICPARPSVRPSSICARHCGRRRRPGRSPCERYFWDPPKIKMHSVANRIIRLFVNFFGGRTPCHCANSCDSEIAIPPRRE